MSEETFLRDDLPNGEYADWLFDKLKACVAERDELRAENERLEFDLAAITAERDRLKAYAHTDYEYQERLRAKAERRSSLISDEVARKATRIYALHLTPSGQYGQTVTPVQAMRAALEAVWPA